MTKTKTHALGGLNTKEFLTYVDGVMGSYDDKNG